MSLKQQSLKNVDKRIQRYIRKSESLLPSTTYYNIPELVNYLCTSYYFIHEKWDPKTIGTTFQILDDDCIKKISDDGYTTYLTNVVSEGIHHWSFKIIATSMSTPEIGVLKIDKNSDDSYAPHLGSYFTKNSSGYAYITGMAKKK
eukprot:358694_1